MFKAEFDFNKKEIQADFNINIIPSISHLATKEELEKAADKHFEFEQGIASDTWIIEHNLGKKPSIMIVDSADNVVEGAERYIDENTIEVRFNGAFKGKAYLN